jgi:hypothetical protein
MDRNKIEEAARLDAELKNLEWLQEQCVKNGHPVDYESLMQVLSLIGRTTCWTAIKREANADRIALERKIAEL